MVVEGTMSEGQVQGWGPTKMIVNNPLDPLPFMSELGHAHRELLNQTPGLGPGSWRFFR